MKVKCESQEPPGYHTNQFFVWYHTISVLGEWQRKLRIRIESAGLSNSNC